jgi:hypothetical protein
MDHLLQARFDRDQLLNLSRLQLNISFSRNQLNLSLPCCLDFLKYHHQTQYQAIIQSHLPPYWLKGLIQLTIEVLFPLELWQLCPPPNYRGSPL